MIIPSTFVLALTAVLPPPGLVGRFGDPNALSGDVILRLSSDGRYLLAGEGLYDVSRGRRAAFDWPEGLRAADLWFTPDGRLAHVAPDHIRVIDPASRETVRQYPIPKTDDRGTPAAVDFSADGTTAVMTWGHRTHELVVSGRDGRRPPATLDAGNCDVLAVSADGSRVAVMTWDEKEVVVWDTRAGRPLGKTPVYNPKDTYIGSRPAALSPDGDTVAHFDENCGLVLYAARGGGIRAKSGVTPDDLFRLEYAPDGKTLTGWSWAGELITFDAETAAELRRRKIKPAAAAGVADWDQTTDGRVTVVRPTDGPVRVWVAGEEKPRLEIPYQGPVSAIGFGAPDAAIVVRGNRRFGWALRTGKTNERPATDRDRLALAAAGRPAVVRVTGRVDEPRRAEFIDPETGEVVLGLPVSAKYEGWDPATAVGAGLVAVTQDKGVGVFDRATGKRRFHWPDPESQGTSALAFTADGRFLLCGLTPSYILRDDFRFAADGPSLVVLELTTGLPRRTVVLPVKLRTNPEIRGLWPDRAGRTCLVGLSGGALVLDTRAWRPTAELEGETPLTVSPDGRWAVLKDGGLWDTRHPSAGPIRLAYSFVSEAAFSPDSRRLVIGHPDGTASAWDVDVLATHSAARARRAAPTLDQLWERLAGRDGEQAEDAIARLAARPGKAIALVAARVRPVPPVDPAAVRERVAGLNAPRFADREAASRWLLEAGEQVVPEVRKTMAGRPSAEQRRRLEDLLARFEARDQAPDLVRAVRSVELLERVGGPGARRALEDLAGGAPGARLTAEAKAALARLDP